MVELLIVWEEPKMFYLIKGRIGSVFLAGTLIESIRCGACNGTLMPELQSASPNMASTMTRECSMVSHGQSQSTLDDYLYLYIPQANRYECRRINQVFGLLTLFYFVPLYSNLSALIFIASKRRRGCARLLTVGTFKLYVGQNVKKKRKEKKGKNQT